MRTVTLAVMAVVSAAVATPQSWDKPRDFKASQILTETEKKGPHHSVDKKVKVEGFYFVFSLKTDFGDLKPVGRDVLKKRIKETAALEALNEVSKTGVFLESAGRSAESMGKGLVHVAKDPKGTAKGLGAGIKRFGVNLGRKSKRVAEDVTDDDDDEKEKTSTGEQAENVADSLLGVNTSARVWAQKLQVDPYSRNPILQKTLLEIAKIDAAGGIALKVVVPIPTAVSTTSSVGGLVWSKDPEELRKTNEAGLKAVGVSEDVSGKFFRNDHFTLTDQTRFVAALTAVKAKGLADYVDTARHADNPREALFFVESAEMLELQHSQAAVKQILTDSRAMVAASGGRAFALLPIDYLAWTKPVSESATEIAERAKKELGTSGLEMRLTGQASSRSRTGLQAIGWNLKEDVPGGGPGGD